MNELPQPDGLLDGLLAAIDALQVSNIGEGLAEVKGLLAGLMPQVRVANLLNVQRRLESIRDDFKAQLATAKGTIREEKRAFLEKRKSLKLADGIAVKWSGAQGGEKDSKSLIVGGKKADTVKKRLKAQIQTYKPLEDLHKAGGHLSDEQKEELQNQAKRYLNLGCCYPWLKEPSVSGLEQAEIEIETAIALCTSLGLKSLKTDAESSRQTVAALRTIQQRIETEQVNAKSTKDALEKVEKDIKELLEP